MRRGQPHHPCIDFGHLNARTLGGIQTKADYAAILDRMAEVLGDRPCPAVPCALFPPSSTRRAAKTRHWTFAETQFGPEPQP
mgnify:CR=1 FL=1